MTRAVLLLTALTAAACAEALPVAEPLSGPLAERYAASCAPCHDNGAGDAPRTGCRDSWVHRERRGEEALFASVRDGMVAMPPRGMCAQCTDDDLRKLVAYLRTGKAP